MLVELVVKALIEGCGTLSAPLLRLLFPSKCPRRLRNLLRLAGKAGTNQEHFNLLPGANSPIRSHRPGNGERRFRANRLAVSKLKFHSSLKSGTPIKASQKTPVLLRREGKLNRKKQIRTYLSRQEQKCSDIPVRSIRFSLISDGTQGALFVQIKAAKLRTN